MSPVDDSTLYSQVGEQLRHYLTWREKLLGGYAAIIAALGLVFTHVHVQHPTFAPWLTLMCALLTIGFWLLERRNRELFDSCVNAGAALERSASRFGVFTAISKTPTRPTHTVVLGWFFGLASATFLVATVLLWRAMAR